MEEPLISDNRSSVLKNFVVNNRNLKIGIILAIVVLVVILAIAIPVGLHASKGKPKNIIFIIADGFGPASVSLARVVSGGNLTLDRKGLLKGTVRTYSSNSWVTDSAAGATAYSCGLKTYNSAIGVNPEYKPCGTLAEAAKENGMKVGLVVTSRITHATPASFSSHSVERDFEEFIADQQVKSGFDLFFGGGLSKFNKRSDGMNLVSVAQELGYSFITTLAEFEQKLSLPIFGLFAKSHMSFEIDRNPLVQPSLAQMVGKAIELLQNDDRGFFLLVEASRIDMAGHNNDAAGEYHDIMAYNEALQVILQFAEEHGNTLVIGTADHETGGLDLGRNFNNDTYPVYNWFPSYVRAVTMSTEEMAASILSGNSTLQVLSDHIGFVPTADEVAYVDSKIPLGDEEFLAAAIGNVYAARALIGWSTLGHTGVDVNLYSYGPGSEKLGGNYENIEIGAFVAEELMLNLAAATEKVSSVNPYPSQNVTQTRSPRYALHD